MLSKDSTRYGLPPEQDAFRPFPVEAPWNVPISELSDLWLRISCVCGTSTGYPLRLLAGEIGWTRTLREVIPKLRCKSCGAHPREILLTSQAYDKGPKAASHALMVGGQSRVSS